VLTLRNRQQRSLLGTLLLSQGVPMLLHGDEVGRTQQGNNNGYCQDNELSWVDWSAKAVDPELLDFVQRLVHLRREHPVFRRRRFFQGADVRGASGDDEIAWFRPDGEHMGDEDWTGGYARSLAVFLNGARLPDVDARGEPVRDDSFLILMNAHNEEVDFVLPDGPFGDRWTVQVDTADDSAGMPTDAAREVDAGAVRVVAAHGLVLLRRES
jgi:isoamylase